MGNSYLKPYTYNSKQIDNANMTALYNELGEQIPSISKFGSSEGLFGFNEDGTLLDYAYSQNIFAYQVALGGENEKITSPDVEFYEYHYQPVLFSMKKANFDIRFTVNPDEKYCGDKLDCLYDSDTYIRYKIKVENTGLSRASSLQLKFEFSNNFTSEYTFLFTMVTFSNSNSSNFEISNQTSTGIDLTVNFTIDIGNELDISIIIERNMTYDAQSKIMTNFTVLLYDTNLKEFEDSVYTESGSFEISQEVDDRREHDDENSSKGIAIGIGVGIGVVFFIIIVGIVCYCCKSRKNHEFIKTPNLNTESLPTFKPAEGSTAFKPVSSPSSSISIPPQRFLPSRL